MTLIYMYMYIELEHAVNVANDINGNGERGGGVVGTLLVVLIANVKRLEAN